MELPFSPSFFKKLEIYQILCQYEKEKENENVWEFEKRILIWAYKHNFPQRLFGSEEKEAVLVEAVNKRLLNSQEIGKIPGTNVVLGSLSHRGFAEITPSDENKAIINRSGYLAGEILIETNNLKSVFKFEFWRDMWWVILILGFLFLFSQTASVIISLIEKII